MRRQELRERRDRKCVTTGLTPTRLQHRGIIGTRRRSTRRRLTDAPGKDSKHRYGEPGGGEGLALGVLVGQLLRRVDAVKRQPQLFGEPGGPDEVRVVHRQDAVGLQGLHRSGHILYVEFRRVDDRPEFAQQSRRERRIRSSSRPRSR